MAMPIILEWMILLILTMFYMALFCAFVTSSYSDSKLEFNTKGMLVAYDVKLTSYVSTALTVGNLVYIAVISVTESRQYWPSLFLVAISTQGIAKMLYVLAILCESCPFHDTAVDYTALAQGLSIAHSQCLIFLQIFKLDSEKVLVNFLWLLFFLASSCSNVFGVYAKQIGLAFAEYFMIPFLVLLYFIASRWILFRSTSKLDNGLISTSKIDVLCIVFILPNMCHLFPRLFLLQYGKETMYSPRPWLLAVSTMATTFAYGLATILFRRIVPEDQQIVECNNALKRYPDELVMSQNDDETCGNMTLDEEIIKAVEIML